MAQRPTDRGERIRALRIKRGLSMDEVAKRAGISRQAVSRIETTGGIAVTTLEPLARALGIPVTQLL